MVVCTADWHGSWRRVLRGSYLARIFCSQIMPGGRITGQTHPFGLQVRRISARLLCSDFMHQKNQAGYVDVGRKRWEQQILHWLYSSCDSSQKAAEMSDFEKTSLKNSVPAIIMLQPWHEEHQNFSSIIWILSINKRKIRFFEILRQWNDLHCEGYRLMLFLW